MKKAYFLSALMLCIGSAANAVEFNKEALKSMQEEGHKIVEESQAGRVFKTAGGECLDIAGAGMVVRNCNASAKTQQWSLSGQGHLISHDGRCVTGAKLQKCGAGQAQQWKHDGNGRLINATQKCLQVQGNPPKPGAKVVAANCSKAPNQVWN